MNLISGSGFYGLAKEAAVPVSNNPVRGFPRSLYEAYFHTFRGLDPWSLYTDKEAQKWLGYLHGGFRDKCLHSLKQHVFDNHKRSVIANEIYGLIEAATNLAEFLWIKIKFHE